MLARKQILCQKTHKCYTPCRATTQVYNIDRFQANQCHSLRLEESKRSSRVWIPKTLRSLWPNSMTFLPTLFHKSFNSLSKHSASYFRFIYVNKNVRYKVNIRPTASGFTWLTVYTFSSYIIINLLFYYTSHRWIETISVILLLIVRLQAHLGSNSVNVCIMMVFCNSDGA